MINKNKHSNNIHSTEQSCLCSPAGKPKYVLLLGKHSNLGNLSMQPLPKSISFVAYEYNIVRNQVIIAYSFRRLVGHFKIKGLWFEPSWLRTKYWYHESKSAVASFILSN